MIPDLEGLVESKQSAPVDRVRFYLEVLESAAAAREAAAARLRAQVRETAERFPSVFSPSPGDAAAAASWKGSSSDGTGAGSGPGSGAPESDGGPGDGDGGEDAGGEGGEGGGDGADDGEDGSAIVNGGAAVGKAEEDEGLRDAETVTVEADDNATDASAAVGEDEGGPADDSSSYDKGARGQDKGNGGNVFGMVGKFLLGVVHAPHGEESDQACEHKETHGEGAADSSSAAPVASTPPAVDTTSPPNTPNAVGKGAPAEGDGDAVAEAAGVSVESVVVETA